MIKFHFNLTNKLEFFRIIINFKLLITKKYQHSLTNQVFKVRVQSINIRNCKQSLSPCLLNTTVSTVELTTRMSLCGLYKSRTGRHKYVIDKFRWVIKFWSSQFIMTRQHQTCSLCLTLVRIRRSASLCVRSASQMLLLKRLFMIRGTCARYRNHISFRTQQCHLSPFSINFKVQKNDRNIITSANSN